MSDIAAHLEPLFGPSGDAEAVQRLSAHAVISHVPAGARLFASGDVCENFVIVASGHARVQISTRTGREITLFRLGPGQACALTTSCLLSESPYYAEGIAETDLDIVTIPSKAFRDVLAASPGLMHHLLEDYAARIAGLTSLVDRLTSRDLDTELADLILAQQDDKGVVSLSHRVMADELGTAREVVSRKLKEMERAKVVKLGRGRLTVTDDNALKRRRERP